MPLRSTDFQRILRPNKFTNKKTLGLQVPKSCTYLDPTLFCISILGTYIKFVRKNKMLALGVCLLQCPSACRRFAASRSRLNYSWQFLSFPHWNKLFVSNIFVLYCVMFFWYLNVSTKLCDLNGRIRVSNQNLFAFIGPSEKLFSNLWGSNLCFSHILVFGCLNGQDVIGS